MFGTNQLNKVQDGGTIHGLLSGTKDSDAEVYIWRLLGGEKHIGMVRIESLRKQRGDFCIVPQDGQDRIVQDLIGGLDYIDLYIPHYSLLMRCTVKQTDAPFRYYLKIPDFVAQVERRKSLRLNVHDESEIGLVFGKETQGPRPLRQHFSKNCVDISSGGFSFYVSRTEAKLFQEQDQIHKILLKSDKWNTQVDAVVTAVMEVEPDEFNALPYKVWRVSCSFRQIDQVSRKYLEKFIFERIKGELHVING